MVFHRLQPLCCLFFTLPGKFNFGMSQTFRINNRFARIYFCLLCSYFGRGVLLKGNLLGRWSFVMLPGLTFSRRKRFNQFNHVRSAIYWHSCVTLAQQAVRACIQGNQQTALWCDRVKLNHVAVKSPRSRGRWFNSGRCATCCAALNRLTRDDKPLLAFNELELTLLLIKKSRAKCW